MMSKNSKNSVPLHGGPRRVKSIGLTIGIILLGVAIGVICSMLAFERVVYVDFTTGAVKETMSIGPVLMQEVEVSATGFELIPLSEAVKNEVYKREGYDPNYVVALRFVGWSGVSPNTRGGAVLAAMNSLASSVHVIGCDEAIAIKSSFVEDLIRLDPRDAASKAQDRVGEAMDKAFANSRE